MEEMTNRTLALALIVGLAGCGAHGDLPPPVEPMAEYRLGLDDMVDVMVWKEPALSASVPIRPDGKISLPMIGDVIAAGRTTTELRDEVAKRLQAVVPSPVVSVMVKEVRASRFYVLGEVAHPGAYPLNGYVTILEAVAIAGGATEFARTGGVVVIRQPTGKTAARRIKVSLDDIVGGHAQTIPLTAGDTVYVP
jgi:polysaccharide export outer membrane protein